MAPDILDPRTFFSLSAVISILSATIFYMLYQHIRHLHSAIEANAVILRHVDPNQNDFHSSAGPCSASTTEKRRQQFQDVKRANNKILVALRLQNIDRHDGLPILDHVSWRNIDGAETHAKSFLEIARLHCDAAQECLDLAKRNETECVTGEESEDDLHSLMCA